MPEALGKYVVIKVYVGDKHSGNMKNKRTNDVIIIYVNNAPITQYIKLQNTVEVFNCRIRVCCN